MWSGRFSLTVGRSNVGEQAALQLRCKQDSVVIGLICGSDGVVALPADDYFTIASPREAGVHVACRRQHDKHYEVSGPDGVLVHHAVGDPTATGRGLFAEALASAMPGLPMQDEESLSDPATRDSFLRLVRDYKR